IGSTPQSTLVLDTDFSLNIPRSKYFPLSSKLSGELAYSQLNPNTIGSASIDDMEGIRQSYNLSMNPDSWQIAATPSAFPAHPDWLFYHLDEDDISLRDVNPRVPATEDEMRRVLHLNYRLPQDHPLDPGRKPEASIVQVISKTGADLSERDTIALWIKGDGKGAELRIDFGSISEDADGTGKLKTEDLNYNGMLDFGEDEGWDYIFGNQVFPIGERNSRIDSNDLNRDGYLDTSESVQIFDSLSEPLLYLNWEGWKLVYIPIATTQGDWTAVKEVRLTLSGRKISGRIEIMSIDAIGNRWEIVGDANILKINAVNNFDSDSYVEITGEKDFEKLYEGVGGLRSDRDQSLELVYSGLLPGTTAYAFTRYPTGMDFTTHKTFSFFLYGAEGGGADIGVWLGAGTEGSENYYFVKVPASDILPTWRRYSFKFPEDFEVVSGSPSPANIMEIRVAPVNSGSSAVSGKIWVNEIHMSNPDSREGTALRGDFSTSIPGIIDFGGSFEKQDRDFQTIVMPAKNQDTETISANARLTLIPFLPVTGSFARTSVITPPDRIVPSQRNPYLREEDAGEVITDTIDLGANFSMRFLPSLNAAYSRSVSESNLTGKTDITENYRGDLSYSFPLNLPLIPKNIRASLRKTDTIVEWEEYCKLDNPEGGYENRHEETLAYSGSADLALFNLLNFRPSFSRNEKYRTWDYYSGPLKGTEDREPWSISQDLALSAQMTLVDWLRPSGQASVKMMENYNFISTSTLSIPADTKNISRNFSASLNVGLPVRNIIGAFKPVDSLNINTSYTAEKGDLWQDVPSNYTVFDKINPNYSLEPSTDTEKTPDTLTSRSSIRHTINWSPFTYLGMNEGLLNLIGGVAVRANYDLTESRRDVKGTVLDTITKLWPEFEFNHGAVDKLPYTGDYLRNLRLRTNISFREESNYSNEEHIDLGIQKRYGANCRFLVLKHYDSMLEFTKNINTKDNIRDDSSTLEEILTLGGQIRMTIWDNWNFIFRYSQKTTEKTSTLSETPLTDLRQYKPGISFDSILDLPSTINLPFIKREIAMASRMKVTGAFDAEFSRSELDVDKTNYDRYSLSGKSELDLVSNIRMTLGLGGQYMRNKIIRENSYISFFISTDLLIIF
ncbi:MAG: hypothetical protein GX817_04100, partial [Elusimicrobia bacterium]|nr:hypothetical protein [Elusimicrobiota bacterium]